MALVGCLEAIAQATGWSGASPEIRAALIGAGGTLLAAGAGVLGISTQMRAQGRQSRQAIIVTEARRMRTQVLEEGLAAARAFSEQGAEFTALLAQGQSQFDVMLAARANGWRAPLPTLRFPALHETNAKFGKALVDFVIMIEGRQYIDPRIIVFRSALSAVQYDLLESFVRGLVNTILPVLPIDMPQGGLAPYADPSDDQIRAARATLSETMKILADASGIGEDFRNEFQNLLSVDLFGHHVEPRVPIDPRVRVISLDRYQEIEADLAANTAWGRNCAQVEMEARERAVAAQQD